MDHRHGDKNHGIRPASERFQSSLEKPEGKRRNEKRTLGVFRNQVGDTELDRFFPYPYPEVEKHGKKYGRFVQVRPAKEEVEDVLEGHMGIL